MSLSGLAAGHELAEQRERYERRIAALRAQLTEKEAALAAAGEALERVAHKVYLRPGSGERYEQCAFCKEWAEEGDEGVVEHDDACPVGQGLSAPVVARAVELDRARRDLCSFATEAIPNLLHGLLAGHPPAAEDRALAERFFGEVDALRALEAQS